jgi:hypothetical protein
MAAKAPEALTGYQEAENGPTVTLAGSTRRRALIAGQERPPATDSTTPDQIGRNAQGVPGTHAVRWFNQLIDVSGRTSEHGQPLLQATSVPFAKNPVATTNATTRI